MNRRTALKALLGAPLAVVGCKEAVEAPAEEKPAVVEDRLEMAQKMSLIDAISAVECGIPGNKVTILNAGMIRVGEHGERGPLQITPIYLEDVNRIANTHFNVGHLFSISHCRGMMLVYWDHYATPQRLGHEPTLEDLSRIHNGGPNGWRKKCTKPYWIKVKAELEKLG